MDRRSTPIVAGRLLFTALGIKTIFSLIHFFVSVFTIGMLAIFFFVLGVLFQRERTKEVISEISRKEEM